MLAPDRLIELRSKGNCILTIPESLFDLDYPGHYLRRIKTVAVSIPCVAGPYVGVQCTVRLSTNSVRFLPDATSGYEQKPTGDARFVDDFAQWNDSAICTSGGLADAGLFDVNLRDEKYLPFEGAGVISTWQIELPADTNTFDRSTISDVVLHVRYTARDGGEDLKTAALGALKKSAIKGVALFSATRDFSDARAVALQTPGASLELPVRVGADMLPLLRAAFKVRVVALDVFVQLSSSTVPSAAGDKLTIAVGRTGGALDARSLTLDGASTLASATWKPSPLPLDADGIVSLALDDASATISALVEDLFVVVHYEESWPSA